jgi:hypothetical protein
VLPIPEFTRRLTFGLRRMREPVGAGTTIDDGPIPARHGIVVVATAGLALVGALARREAPAAQTESLPLADLTVAAALCGGVLSGAEPQVCAESAGNGWQCGHHQVRRCSGSLGRSGRSRTRVPHRRQG